MVRIRPRITGKMYVEAIFPATSTYFPILGMDVWIRYIYGNVFYIALWYIMVRYGTILVLVLRIPYGTVPYCTVHTVIIARID